MRTYRKSAGDDVPGTWQELMLPDGRRSASFICPGCGRLGTLLDHHIGAYCSRHKAVL